MIRAVLFDLDGTLVDRDSGVRALIGAQHEVFAAALTQVPRATYVREFLALDQHGHGDKSEAYERLADAFALRIGMASALTGHFWTNYASHVHAFPEVLQTLRTLRARNVKLGIVTNGSVAVQEAVIAAQGLGDLVDVVAISEREGTRKPQPEIFTRALAVIGVPAAEAWFVGDHPTLDVEGAAAAGIAAVWRRNEIWPAPNGTYRAIDSLADVIGLLDECRAPAA